MRFSIQPPRLLRSKEARKNKSAQISNLTLLLYKKIALIHKNVFEMFLRCTVYELWFNSVCRFCMDPTLCYVVWVSNQKLNEQSVCSRFAWRYSLSQLSIRTLEYLTCTIHPLSLLRLLPLPLFADARLTAINHPTYNTTTFILYQWIRNSRWQRFSW